MNKHKTQPSRAFVSSLPCEPTFVFFHSIPQLPANCLTFAIDVTMLLTYNARCLSYYVLPALCIVNVCCSIWDLMHMLPTTDFDYDYIFFRRTLLTLPITFNFPAASLSRHHLVHIRFLHARMALFVWKQIKITAHDSSRMEKHWINLRK